jgi:hypothetical protein
MRRDGFVLQVPQSVLSRRMLVERLLPLKDYLDRLAKLVAAGEAPAGIGLLGLDDVPPHGIREPIMCFSGHDPNHYAIPDCLFLKSRGYEAFRRIAAQSAPAWSDRKSQLYWRGALTGLAPNYAAVFDLPRTRVALLDRPEINAKLTSIDQYAQYYPALEMALREKGALQEREGEEENLRYRWLLDIDGNSNSWPGLFLKLLTGGCVVKVMTSFRQWYYERLEDRRNIIAVSDLGELPDVIGWCLAHDDDVADIGGAGRKMAMAMSADSEFEYLVTAWNSVKAA